MTAIQKILVIDDDQDLRESIIEILEDNNFRVQGCDSAESALERIEEESPFLIIVDNMMPGMGGMALIPILKNRHPEIKIIMITAFSTVDNAVSAMRAGADDYLAKPFRRNELLVAVQRAREELKFEQRVNTIDMDATFSGLANPIRRQILLALSGNKTMGLMELTRQLEISDHTKVNFHLKNLKTNDLVHQDREKAYSLSTLGEKMILFIHTLTETNTL